MQVLFKRSLNTRTLGAESTTFSPIKYELWVKFAVSQEERRLISLHNLEGTYLTIEQSRRDFYRAALICFFPAAIVGGISINGLPIGISMFLFFAIWGVGTWLLYGQLCEAIKVLDVLEGRKFKDRSFMLFARRERRMIGYAVAFSHLLKELGNWEGEEIITLGEEHESALRLVTDTPYAPA
jgi:hypothetical protein